MAQKLIQIFLGQLRQFKYRLVYLHDVLWVDYIVSEIGHQLHQLAVALVIVEWQYWHTVSQLEPKWIYRIIYKDDILKFTIADDS